MKNIIKTDNYLLIVDDSEIKSYYYDSYVKGIRHSNGAEYGENSIVKQIIAHLPLNNSPILEGVLLLPPLEDEVEKLAFDYTSVSQSHRRGFIDGYNKAKEKYKYTEEDLIKFSDFIERYSMRKYSDGWKRITNDPNVYPKDFATISDKQLVDWYNEEQPKYPIGFECEMETPYTDAYAEDRMRRFYGKPKPKTTTNSQGQTVLEGKYIYE